MAMQFITSNRTAFLDLGTVDDAMVVAGVSVSSTSGIGINSNGSNQEVYVYGTVAASGTGIYLGFGAVQANTCFIGASGVVSSGFNAVTLEGMTHTAINHGTIIGLSAGIKMFGAGTGNVVQNYGTISSNNIGISVDTTSANSGQVTNYGLISGKFRAFESLGGTYRDTITNFGTMQGDVLLGGGNDTFANRGAGVVNGTIFGGAGEDTFILGAGAETINGGEGTDYIDFHQSNGVRFTLDDSFDNTGLAAGDTFVSIEGVFGSRRADFIVGGIENNSFVGAGGNDTLIGGAGLDSLFGGIGVDQINGGDGADLLDGGLGKDIVTGGLGDDEFRFNFLTHGGDIITDFSNRVGNNDRITINADELTIFGILGPRALSETEFHVGRTNIAPGAEDRIIVRTTDNTVWFDSNGRAAGGLTLIADLQAGVTLTFADFFFV
jgi:Ca2+-binding RTX toxin-like protein